MVGDNWECSSCDSVRVYACVFVCKSVCDVAVNAYLCCLVLQVVRLSRLQTDNAP